LNDNNEHTTIKWFGFEINHSQSLLLLILALTGGLNFPFGILNGLNKFLEAIFYSLPVENFREAIIILFESIVFLFLCWYTIIKILKIKQKSTFNKINVKNQVRSWFGFKINQSQSILLFMISLVGLIVISFSYFHGVDAIYQGLLFRKLYEIPYDNTVLQRYAFNFIHLVFFLISLYTLIEMKIERVSLSMKKYNKNHQLVIFIIALTIILFLVPRIFYHIITFTPLRLLIGIDPPIGLEITSYFFTDFVIITLITFVCTIIISFLLKRVPKERRVNKELKFRTPKFLVFTLSTSSYIFLLIFSQSLRIILIGQGYNIYNYGFFPTMVLDLFFLLLILIPFLILLGYITKIHKMEGYLERLESSINKKWLIFTIKRKSYILVIFWISLAQLIFISINLYLLYPRLGNDSIKDLEIFIISIFIGLEAIFCVFSITKLYSSQK